MSTRARIASFVSLFVASAGALYREDVWAAPSRDPLSRDALRGIYAAAGKLGEGAPRCVPVDPDREPPPDNLRAEVMHEQAAALHGVVLLQYPRASVPESPEQRADRIAQLEDQLTTAIASYKQAYACHPGQAGARHLTAALDLVAAFVDQLHAREDLPAGAPAYKNVERRAEALRAELPRPVHCTSPHCREPAPTGSAPGRPTGDRGNMGRGFFRSELGVGGGVIEYREVLDLTGTGLYRLDKNKARVLGPAFRVSTGLRQRVGARDRHVLLVGGFYTFQHLTRLTPEAGAPRVVAVESQFRMVHAAGLSLEWGVRFAGGKVSLHTAAEFGVQAYHGNKTFGHFRYGGAVGPCFLDELICVLPRIHSFWQPTEGRTYWGYEVTVGFDLFRAIDRGLARDAAR